MSSRKVTDDEKPDEEIDGKGIKDFEVYFRISSRKANEKEGSYLKVMTDRR